MDIDRSGTLATRAIALMHLASELAGGVLGHARRGREQMPVALARCIAEPEVAVFHAPEEDRRAAVITGCHDQ